MIGVWLKGILTTFISFFYICCTPQTSSHNYQPNNHPTTIEKMTTCAIAIKNIEDKDFSLWQGLPEKCDWTSLTGPLPNDWQSIPERLLGRNFRKGKIRMAKLEGYTRPSLTFIDGQAVLFEAMNPALSIPLDQLIDRLGVPKAALDWNFGTLPCSKSEYVYPRLGITLFLSEDKTRIFHIALYVSTTLENYLDDLRPNLGKKRLPKRK